MSNMTKYALEASLKKLLLQKPLDKVTINDLTSDCGISRMAFYYHFKDIYDLVEWICLEDATRALQGKKTYDNWQDGLRQIFEVVLENKSFILNVYHSVSREQIENYLYKLTYGLIIDVVEEKAAGIQIAEVDKKFIADFYKYSFVGIMLDWIKQGMKADYQIIVEKMSITVKGSIDNSIHNFLTKGKG
ncbi:MAG: TetR family transcriptional regulator C-terminal domain-containing protein [Lachnospiraceae bacterium]|nr:TetR family transcriptional regulator C-terminal domain-containing protein [Lachnospiraceae bacterium]